MASRMRLAAEDNQETIQTAPPNEQEELASVVVAADTKDAPHAPWYIVMRPWLFCLLFLGLFECAARLTFDFRPTLRRERFDNFPSAASENAFVAQMARDKAYKVLLIGDSTLVGASLLRWNESVSAYLEQNLHGLLPGREVHVWNMSIAGARSGDDLCLLQKALEGKPDFVVIQGNYFVAVAYGDMEIANTWLAYALPEVPAPLRDEMQRVEPHDPKKRFEDNVTALVENNMRLIGMRQQINAMLFGVQPRVPFNTPNPTVMVAAHGARSLGIIKALPWDKRNPPLNPVDYVDKYGRDVTSDNAVARHYPDIIKMLERRNLPALTYLTPQNHALVKDAVTDHQYAERRHTLSAFFASKTIPHFDFCDLVPNEHFNDNDHMLGSGNKILADALAAELKPRLLAEAGNR